MRKRPAVPASAARAAPAPPSATDGIDEQARRVRVPYFPLYSEVRRVLPVWNGRRAADFKHMQTAIWNLQGTPDEPKDWTRPDEWIPVRLDGTDREMALAIWEGTDRKVNPRRVYGHWLLATNYDLITPPDSGPITLTKRGQDFVKESGEAEAAVDEGEGLVKLLSIVAERAPAGARDVLVGWADFLKRYSGFRSDSTIRDSLYRRIRNLLERGLISRSASQYSISAAGLTYLQRVGRADEARAPSAQLGGLLTLAAEHRAGVRRELHRILGSMNPYAFEQLVGQLLEAMDYSGVTVTARSNDKGIDVVADIEVGITSVREVVQAKRHAKAVQRKELDALRGCLHRFKAVRGTLITTGTFSRGTIDAAIEAGAAPITLIDGAKLVDLLIEFGVGVKRNPIETLEIIHEVFAADATPDAGR